jgi:hypothetical protein
MSDVTPAVRATARFVRIIEPIDLQEEMERSFLDYAMSVIVSRRCPTCDGLKPCIAASSTTCSTRASGLTGCT